MKKNLLCVIVLFIVLFSSGCTSVSNDKKDEYYAPLKDTYYFNSYEELETFLSPNQLMKEFTEDNLEFYGENFKNVVSKIVNGKLKYMIPILDEKECTLQKNESQPKIALFTCELYNEPWIWYNVTVNNVDVSIITFRFPCCTIFFLNLSENRRSCQHRSFLLHWFSRTSGYFYDSRFRLCVLYIFPPPPMMLSGLLSAPPGLCWGCGCCWSASSLFSSSASTSGRQNAVPAASGSGHCFFWRPSAAASAHGWA